MFVIMNIITFGDEETAVRLKDAVNEINRGNYKNFKVEKITL